MKVYELIEKMSLTVYTGEVGLDREISGGYVSDLLSDVMGSGEEGNVWITLQNHLNIVAVASLKELACIILVKGIVPVPDVVEKAVGEGIPVLGSPENTYQLTGKIFQIVK